MTESGKTSLAKIMCQKIRDSGYPVLVLDPLTDPGWQADFITTSADKFLKVAKTNTRCLCIIDEAGESVGQFDKERHWLGTRGRHYGHTCFFVAQRAQMIARTVRDQCGVAYIFRLGMDDAKILANEYGYQELKSINSLKQFEFFAVGRFRGLSKYRLDIVQKTCHKISKRGERYESSNDRGGRGHRTSPVYQGQKQGEDEQ
jgi:hypothetical protein